MQSSIPSGTVTFLFTDIEGSTSLAQQSPDAMQALLERHDAILRGAIESHRGTVFQVTGDAFCAAFHTVGDAIQAALSGQYALEREHWAVAPLKVRMGIHTGTAQSQGESPDAVAYAGYLTLAHTQRVMSAAHGGQVLLSNASAELARPGVQDGISLRDLGEHRLKSLPASEHIWQMISPGLREDFPPLRSLPVALGNLPTSFSSFIGREREIREVRRLLDSHRLITLTGPGGTGKTRLSLQAAGGMAESFPHGVWFIELASLSDPALIPNTVASALDVHEQQGSTIEDTLLDWLGSRELLLVVDNCEHLVEACAQLAEIALHSSPGLRILATSREALGLQGEQVYQVPSLECPAPEQAPDIPIKELMEYPAIRLFTDRAQESAPTFRLSLSNARAVVQICHQLDGMPLALELAAARLKLLQVEQIAARLGDRFRLLTNGGRTTLPHHQTLRSLIDWSYDLLTPPEQILMRRLAVFAGGCTLDAAEQACAGDGIEASDVLQLLGRLMDKSLVIVSEDPSGSRYRMLETIRQYALERLQASDEASSLRNRHLEYFVHLAEAAEPRMHSSDFQLWFDSLETERDNWRLALEWSRTHAEIELGLRLAGALQRFWQFRNYWSEGYEATAALLRRAGDMRTTIRARGELAAAMLASDCGYTDVMLTHFKNGIQMLWASGEGGRRLLGIALAQYGAALVDRTTSQARAISEEGVQVSRETGDQVGLAFSLFALGMAARRQSDFDAARAAQQEGMSIFQKLGDQRMYALLLSNLGYTYLFSGNSSEAKRCFDESMRLAKEIGDQYMEANSIAGRADLARRAGNHEEALQLLQQGIAYHRSIGSAHQGLAFTLHGMGLLQLSMGNPSGAETYLKEAAITCRKGRLHFWLRLVLDALGYVAAAKEPARAACLFGAAKTLRAQMGTVLYPHERGEHKKYISLARSQLDKGSWQSCWNAGRSMTFDQAIEYALQTP